MLCFRKTKKTQTGVPIASSQINKKKMNSYNIIKNKTTRSIDLSGA